MSHISHKRYPPQMHSRPVAKKSSRVSLVFYNRLICSQMSRKFLLLYGSVTGKAESIAELIAEEAQRRGFDADLQCMSSVGKAVTSVMICLNECASNLNSS